MAGEVAGEQPGQLIRVLYSEIGRIMSLPRHEYEALSTLSPVHFASYLELDGFRRQGAH